jgi:hypothetical protein
MPAKKVVSFVTFPSESSKEDGQTASEDSYYQILPSIPNCLIFLIIIVFGFSLSFEAFSKMS